MAAFVEAAPVVVGPANDIDDNAGPYQHHKKYFLVFHSNYGLFYLLFYFYPTTC
jgi:hypothetical protein